MAPRLDRPALLVSPFHLNRRGLPWVAAVALSLLIGLASDWERFGDPLVDRGREMNQPLRLLRGERLYADVQHLYGPLSPHLNAVLYGIFGVHLDVLRASGAATTVIIVALIYWLARRLAGRSGAAAAALAATWLCAFQPYGNFVLPYSYSAVHGSALALGALALGIRFIEGRRLGPLVFSGLCAGLALTAKIEMGAAALVGGLAAALVGGPLLLRSLLRRALAFSVPAVAVPAIVYATLAVRVGAHALFEESFLSLRLPGPILFFVRSVFGFEDPGKALAREALVLIQLAAGAALIALAALGLARRTGDAGAARGIALRHGPWVLIVLALAMMRRTVLGIDPMEALPLVVAAVVLVTLVRVVQQWRGRPRPAPRTALALVCGLFGLTSLARTALHVRSNFYGSFMLPAALMMLTYVWTWRVPALLRRPSAVRWARRLGVLTLLAWTAGAGVVATYRVTMRRAYPIVTRRGTMLTLRSRGQAFAEAIRFLERETGPGEPVAVLPEGTALLFLTDRRNPLQEEVATPGLLDEERALRQLESSGTRVILLTNRPTDEYGAHAFGRDYARRTMEWIASRFRVCGVFGRRLGPDPQIGSGPFFIKAYCRA
jgi:hypothetical protein